MVPADDVRQRDASLELARKEPFARNGSARKAAARGPELQDGTVVVVDGIGRGEERQDPGPVEQVSTPDVVGALEPRPPDPCGRSGPSRRARSRSVRRAIGVSEARSTTSPSSSQKMHTSASWP